MRTTLSCALAAVLLVSTGRAADVPLSPGQAAARRGQLVTVRGVVSQAQDTADGVVLQLGTPPALPVLLPPAVRHALRTDPLAWVERIVEATGFVTPPGRLLGLTVTRAESIALLPAGHDGGAGRDGVAALRARVAALERELERLAPRVVNEAETGITVGSTQPRPLAPLPRWSTQTTVLGERGVPTRVEWSADRKVLWYGRDQWIFDADGQLVDVRHD